MHFDGVEWLHGNKHILFTGNETGHPTRTWIHDLEPNKNKPVTPDGTLDIYFARRQMVHQSSIRKSR